MIKMLVCDFDGTISGGSSHGVTQFSEYINGQPDLAFVIATGRTLISLQQGLSNDNYPSPKTIISDVGTQIHHSEAYHSDDAWHTALNARWCKNSIESVLSECDFLGACLPHHQGQYKFTFEGKLQPTHLNQLRTIMESHALEVDLTYSHDWFLDITPKGIDKAAAIHYLMQENGLMAEEICIAGDSANDTAMLTMEGVNAILVANHYQEVAHLAQRENVYRSEASHALGVLEGLKYWQADKA